MSVANLSIEARTVAESLALLAQIGAGPIPGTVVLETSMVLQFANAAQELLDTIQEYQDG